MSRLQAHIDHLEQVRSLMPDVTDECLRQLSKFGVQNHTPAEWLMILGEEVGEVNRAALEAHFFKCTCPIILPNHTCEAVKEHLANYRTELIQVAAVALSAVAAYDRTDPTHFDDLYGENNEPAGT